MIRLASISVVFILFSFGVFAESGYELWLRYTPIQEKHKAEQIKRILGKVVIDNISPTSQVIKHEILLASRGMLGCDPDLLTAGGAKTGLLIATSKDEIPPDATFIIEALAKLGKQGYIIAYRDPGKMKQVIIAANSPVGSLYGTYHLLRMIQSGILPGKEAIIEVPRITHRLLNHWDNLDRTIERGYAGFSIWDWHRLPNYIDQRYIDYARANASIGINGTVLTSVNANSFILTPYYLEKVAALADLFRPYGIKVYLTARFSAPIEIGGMTTADPRDPGVQQWWNETAKTIYEAIPDFGGFLVKANSEGQPGPQNYNRSHAEGANMLADAVSPYGGIVMWRAFVYSHESPEDRAKQANIEFEPLDGTFRENVLIQVKNGAIDFQPREPFHPLFGAMPGTALALELQITQEYLGQGTSLAYLAPMWKECLDADTFRPESNSKVSGIIDGSVYRRSQSVIAGVSNVGNDLNWTGHLFGQANWYAFGRLAWDHTDEAETIAEEWIRCTFGSNPALLETVLGIMMNSHEMVVNYMTPLGLHHIMGRNHHYGPGPWVAGGRPDWTSLYYHRADSLGIGFNRTQSGSNALQQYANEIEAEWSDPASCPEEFLLWFHHLPWNYTMKSGNTLWKELCYRYDRGVKQAFQNCEKWELLEKFIDRERFEQVNSLLKIQRYEAEWWRNACLLYFQQFSRLPFPEDIIQPEGNLDELEILRFPYAPGIRPSW